MANIAKPTSLNNIWAEGGTKIDPGTSKVSIGWIVQLPPYEYQNWIDNRQDRALAHINQHGIPEWDSLTEYQGQLSYTQGSNGVIYKCLQTNVNKDPVSSINSAFWKIAFEDYGRVDIVQSALQAHITNYQTLSGIGNIGAARANLSVYSRLESDTRYASIIGNPAQTFSVAPATAPDHAVRLGQVASLLGAATESNTGVIRLATTAMTEQGTDDTTAVTPLKANTVYLKKSGNLAGLANLSVSRSNLGLGSAAVMSSSDLLIAANNLSDLRNVSTARANLGLTSTATLPENYFLRSGLNLSDVPSVESARANLGLTSTSTTPISSFLLKADNLLGITNQALARSNLGLGDIATQSSASFLQRGNNLSDLTNIQAARNNLGLGGLSTSSALGLPPGVTDLLFNYMTDSTGGAVELPGGFKVQWGSINVGGRVVFRIPYTVSNSIVLTHGPNALGAPGAGITSKSLTGFGLGYGAGGYMWISVGV